MAVNTAAVNNPELIRDMAQRFGSQATVLSVEAKRMAPGRWEAYTDNGRERTGLDVESWVQQAVALGAGEVLLTSVDQEGTCKGFDVELVSLVSHSVSVPVIASGGMGSIKHFMDAASAGADAVAMADVLHRRKTDLATIRDAALSAGLPVRQGE